MGVILIEEFRQESEIVIFYLAKLKERPNWSLLLYYASITEVPLVG